MLYSIMKLHVSARSGHNQVSTPIKRILYICVGGVDVEISTQGMMRRDLYTQIYRILLIGVDT